MCVPLPYVPVLDFCLRLYDVTLPGGSDFQTCIDFETRLVQSPLLVMHFDCVRVGADGVSWIKPGDGEQLLDLVPPTTTPPTTSDEYDPVDFETTTVSDGIALNGTTLSPADEDKIGEHRVSRGKRARALKRS